MGVFIVILGYSDGILGYFDGIWGILMVLRWERRLWLPFGGGVGVHLWGRCGVGGLCAPRLRDAEAGGVGVGHRHVCAGGPRRPQ